jgi:hypothetical protein
MQLDRCIRATIQHAGQLLELYLKHELRDPRIRVKLQFPIIRTHFLMKIECELELM